MKTRKEIQKKKAEITDRLVRYIDQALEHEKFYDQNIEAFKTKLKALSEEKPYEETPMGALQKEKERFRDNFEDSAEAFTERTGLEIEFKIRFVEQEGDCKTNLLELDFSSLARCIAAGSSWKAQIKKEDPNG